ncbi:phosphatase PAP2 family protein [Novosphingobium pokkalii]|uniref:Phosphatase PAP2 family protein n=1 Tax=Novosphingobium pokkalii TaxID=1770194 RepID=A0ABV7UYD6_9SPHN|nr:phosphatase PAP2 family protein [Novosphingobium pokkalii]GHC95620.1 hypothetical protein GCM10019060_24750 [Novosphingobium pokkalii]
MLPALVHRPSRSRALFAPLVRPARQEAVPLVAVAVFALVVLIGTTAGDFTFAHREFDPIILLLLAVWGCAQACSRLSVRQGLVDLCKLVPVFLATALFAPLASAVLARISAPLADASLAALDRQMFPAFSWPDTIAALAAHPALLHALSYTYFSLGGQAIALLLVLALTGQARQGWAFLTAWCGTLLVTIALFPLMPAVGSYAYHAISHAAMPDVLSLSAWNYPHVLGQLRDGSMTVLDGQALEGLVTMPSFHAAAAVLLGWGYARIPRLRWPMIAWNTVMWLSAVPIGGHYLVDVLAGTALAAAAIALVERFFPPSPVPAGVIA